MTTAKPNRFSQFAKPKVAEQPAALAPVKPAAEPKPVSVEPATPPAKRGPGRPKRVEPKPDLQMTTIRLDPDDHLAVRTLALRDKMKMNELVFVALKDYCAKRGIKLQGAPK